MAEPSTFPPSLETKVEQIYGSGHNFHRNIPKDRALPRDALRYARRLDDSPESSSGVETAGYDPPFTPGSLRRNEVLIRLK